MSDAISLISQGQRSTSTVNKTESPPTKSLQFLINSFSVFAQTDTRTHTETDRTENNTLLCHFAGVKGNKCLANAKRPCDCRVL